MVLGQGFIGVQLFFAISGYILCRPFLGGRKVSLKRYFTRRITRLEPPYIISMMLVYTVKVLVLGLVAVDLLPNLLASLAYSHNLIFGRHSDVNGVAWSLEIEWQFYLLAPLIFLAVVRARPGLRHLGLWTAIAIGGLAFVAAPEVGHRVDLSILRQFGFFAAGIWVAVMDEEHASLGRDSYALDALGILSGIAIVVVLAAAHELQACLPALMAAVLLAGIRGRISRVALGWWPVYCIGAMCYTIYLYHFFVVSIVGRMFSAIFGGPDPTPAGIALFSGIASVLVIAACMVPYLLIERPFMVWRPGQNRLSDAFRGLVAMPRRAPAAAKVEGIP
jgi:peptidoglycan/LPS O-acetylase OafA/YrhL